MIEPKILKGFNDALPDEEKLRKKLIRKLEDTLSLYGYMPIDTPVLEYKEILCGKGSDEADKQTFLFTDKGGREVGLRYDLTVPLARFIAMHQNELQFPFKRYHIAKAWRGEKPQKGRFREFYQADFDMIGSDSLLSDFEILLLIVELVGSFGLKNFRLHINDRSLINAIFKKENIEEHQIAILRCIDKTYKIGIESVKKELIEILGNKAESIFFLLEKLDPKTFFSYCKSNYAIENSRLEQIIQKIKSMNLDNVINLDTTITRGLDYYTGLVFETFIENAIDFGSICSGGRYDNLTGLFSQTMFSGIGGSIGLDRLLAYTYENNKIDDENEKKVMIINFNNDDSALYYELALYLHKDKIMCEVYPDAAKIKKQIQYAVGKKIKYAIFLGENELKNNIISLKDLVSGETVELKNKNDLADYLRKPQ